MTIDKAIERMTNKSKLMVSNQAKEDWLQIADWLKELKIFKELYPDTDAESSLVANYKAGKEDMLDQIRDSLTFHQEGLTGYFTISKDEWYKIEEECDGKDI